MISAFSGFALIGVIVLAGWLTRRFAGLPENAETVLGRLVYSVLAPCLLFTGVARADLNVLFSEPLLVSTAAAIVCFALFALLIRRRDRGTTIMGALASGYTNANYIGIPVATYVLGNAALVVPIVMLQLLIITPVALTMLEIATTGHASWRTVLMTPLRNPLISAVALGAVLALTGWRLPSVAADPIDAIGQAAVPVVLIAFGMSLSGRGVLGSAAEGPFAGFYHAIAGVGVVERAVHGDAARRRCGIDPGHRYAPGRRTGLRTRRRSQGVRRRAGRAR
jgi:malonate transporter